MARKILTTRGIYEETQSAKVLIAGGGTFEETAAVSSATAYSVTSGTIDLSGLQTFFGDTGSIALGDLYKGGGIVPDITENASVPASGTISMSDMYGIYKNT